jgi:hypothetical protein
MSLEAMLWALKQAPDVPAQCFGVLMGLAESADRHGRGALPSALTLAAFARKSERQVRADLGTLADLKLIRPGDQALAAYIPAGRRPMVYDLAMERICDLQSTAPRGKPRGKHSRRRDLQSTAPLNDESDLQSTAGVQSTAPQGAADLQEQPGMQSTAGPEGVQSTAGEGCSPASGGVQSTAYKPNYVNPGSKPSSRPRRDLNADRPEIERLCAHLADRIAANGYENPEITKGWRDAARLMIDADGRKEEQIHRAIDWSQGNGFWRKNVRSMQTLREKYVRLQMEADDERKAAANGHAPGPDRARSWAAAGQEYEARAQQARMELSE